MRVSARAFGKAAWSAAAGGVSMAALNIAAEMLRGGSVLGWRDLPRTALWYLLVWSSFSAAWGMLNALRAAARLSSPPAVPLGFPIYVGACLCILGYVHLYWLPLLFSAQSLAWTLLLVLIAGTGYWWGAKVMAARLTERGLVWLSGALALALLASFVGSFFPRPPAPPGWEGPAPGQAHARPNVLLITLDAVRPDHLGCYGYPRATSPNLDHFASGATVFLRAFASSSRTMESAPSLFTSTYPSCHGQHSYSDAIPRSLPILPQAFHWLGYRTAVFSTNRNVSPEYGFGRGVDDFVGRAVDPLDGTLVSRSLERLATAEWPLVSGACRSLLALSHALFASEDRIGTEDPVVITDKAAAWITETEDKPFFAYIHFRGGHGDYAPSAPYDGMFGPAASVPPATSYPRGAPSFPPFSAAAPLPDRVRAGLISQYDGEIRQHDEALGRLLAFLDDSGLAARTIVVITAVHGEEFYEHGGWGHGQSLYDELIHVPLVWRVPGLRTRSNRIDRLVSLIDIFPTLCSLCGIPPGEGPRPLLGGQDLSPLLSGAVDFKGRDYVYAELHQGGHQAQALRTFSYKAIRVRYGRQKARLLYRLDRDPGELHPASDEGMVSWDRMLLEMEEIRNRTCSLSYQKTR
jgi:arylsulfatase A-like enzyme